MSISEPTPPDPQPRDPMHPEPRATFWRHFFHAFNNVTHKLTEEPSRLFALFALLVVAAILIVALAHLDVATALLIALGLLLVFIALVLILFRPWDRKRPRKARGRGGVGLILVGAVFLTAASLGATQTRAAMSLLPSVFPEVAAENATAQFFARFDALFQARNDVDLARAFVSFAQVTTPEFQRKRFDAAAVTWLSTASADETVIARECARVAAWAREFLLNYGRVAGVEAEFIRLASWRQIMTSETKDVAIVVAIASYSGRFLDNPMLDPPTSLEELYDAMTNHDSAKGQKLRDWLLGSLIVIDEDRMWRNLKGIPFDDFAKPNALDLIRYRNPSDFGGIVPESFIEGTEFCWYSIRLERDRRDSAPEWRVGVVGDWGLRRKL